MSREYPARKSEYFQKLTDLLNENKTCIIVNADNVGSNQLQKVRLLLRKDPKAFMLMGKNTMARNCIRKVASENPKVEKILPFVRGNIGFVFTNDDAKAVRDACLSVKVPAAAKAGSIAPCDVMVPAGPTGLDPGQTAFFQSMNIATKIVKGSVEIVSDVNLIKKGDKVGTSEVSLLSKLNIKPFSFGLQIVKIYEDGATYDSNVLDLTESDLFSKFFNGVSKVAAISLKIGYPTLASLPHSFARGFLNLVALAVSTEYNFERANQFKEFLANPDAFVVAAPAAASSGSAKAAEPEPVKEKSASEVDMGFSLFD
eukprot:TRINITY_DN2253_c0_g1_i1.p2 TRINITY_DN2253_c0_g1~~TRINITY_DN2253_c0_g1_i1.p2  ORF type:complete len:314 (+),score=151.20 TRINITY_DN2253_c0_g1_i1:113-1054(+)